MGKSIFPSKCKPAEKSWLALTTPRWVLFTGSWLLISSRSSAASPTWRLYWRLLPPPLLLAAAVHLLHTRGWNSPFLAGKKEKITPTDELVRCLLWQTLQHHWTAVVAELLLMSSWRWRPDSNFQMNHESIFSLRPIHFLVRLYVYIFAFTFLCFLFLQTGQSGWAPPRVEGFLSSLMIVALLSTNQCIVWLISRDYSLFRTILLNVF